MRNNLLYQKFKTAVATSELTLDGVKLLTAKKVAEFGEAEGKTETFIENMKHLLIAELQQEMDNSVAGQIKNDTRLNFPKADAKATREGNNLCIKVWPEGNPKVELDI